MVYIVANIRYFPGHYQTFIINFNSLCIFIDNRLGDDAAYVDGGAEPKNVQVIIVFGGVLVNFLSGFVVW